MQNLKESWQNIPEKTRKIVKAIAAGTAAIALIAIIALFFLGSDREYSTLFTGLNQEEAQQLVGLLQDEDISYRYDPGSGTIRVLSSVVDQTRASLLSRGYPKSGFTYDMYLDNTGLMTTESDKEQITLYELQDRLGAQIRLFEGVQDAKVVINEASERKYALGDDTQMSASASVVVTMKDGNALTEERARAVKTLISHAVRGMNFTDVAVLDAATMTEVASDSGGSSGNASDLTSLTSLVENSIAGNVRRVLEQLYGTGSVAVSVKGTLNMERLIQETTQYTTPEKIDEEDKDGLLETEDLTGEGAYGADQGAGGVVGTDANADTPRYTNEDGTAQVDEGYNSYTASRQWLYNILKEQRQIDPGVLEDVSIGVVIITDDAEGIPEETLRRLVANSAGVPVETADDKITIVRAPGPEITEEIVVQPPEGFGALVAALPLGVWIAIIGGIVLLILLLILLLVRSKKKKKREEAEVLEIMGGEELSADDLAGGEVGGMAEGAANIPGMAEMEDEFTKNEEILNLRMQRSLRLKQNIAEFVDQNPQIVAKLIQGWLTGEGEEEDGRSGNRKQSK